MTSEQPNRDRPPRKYGQTFNLDEEQISSQVSRQAKVFTPDQNEVLVEVPEAITSGERLPHVSEYSSIRLINRVRSH